MFDLDYLKSHCTLIHYFGLGFVQLKLRDGRRMHFYTESLPAIVGDDDVHNHRYDFTSQVLSGYLVQHIYRVVPGDTHTLEQESCKKKVLDDRLGEIVRGMF